MIPLAPSLYAKLGKPNVFKNCKEYEFKSFRGSSGN